MVSIKNITAADIYKKKPHSAEEEPTEQKPAVKTRAEYQADTFSRVQAKEAAVKVVKKKAKKKIKLSKAEKKHKAKKERKEILDKAKPKHQARKNKQKGKPKRVKQAELESAVSNEKQPSKLYAQKGAQKTLKKTVWKTIKKLDDKT